MIYQLDYIARVGDLFVQKDGYLSVVHKYGANAFKIVDDGYEFLGTWGRDMDLANHAEVEEFATDQIDEFRTVLARLNKESIQ